MKIKHAEKSTPLLILALSIYMLLAGITARADESFWLYAKGADSMPKDKLELKLGMISRRDKNYGSYVFNDIRPEIEYGLTDRLTLMAEWMVFDHDYSISDEDLNPMFETQGGNGKSFDEIQSGGYELGLKYMALSPYKDAIGLALGFAYEHRQKYRLDGADIDQDSWVPSIIFQKNYLDDTLITTLTIKTEFERRKSPGVLEEELGVDIAGGITYRVRPNVYLGLELRHQSDYLNPQEEGEFDPMLKRTSFDLSDVRIGTQHQNGNYFGPTFHFSQPNWWVTAGALWQFKGGGSYASFSSDGRNWDEHEKVHIGVTFGWEYDRDKASK